MSAKAVQATFEQLRRLLVSQPPAELERQPDS